MCVRLFVCVYLSLCGEPASRSTCIPSVICFLVFIFWYGYASKRPVFFLLSRFLCLGFAVVHSPRLLDQSCLEALGFLSHLCP